MYFLSVACCSRLWTVMFATLLPIMFHSHDAKKHTHTHTHTLTYTILTNISSSCYNLHISIFQSNQDFRWWSSILTKSKFLLLNIHIRCNYLLNFQWKRRQHHFWICVFNTFCSLVENERCKQVTQHNNQIHLSFLGDSAICLWFTNPSQGSRSQKIHKCQIPRVMVVEVGDYASKHLWLSFIV